MAQLASLAALAGAGISAYGQVRQAQQQALAAVRQVQLPGAHWRSDIGHRAIKH